MIIGGIFGGFLLLSRLLLSVYTNVWRYANSKAYLTMVFSDVVGGFISLVVLDGKAELLYKGGKMEISKGDSVFVPAGMNVNLVGEAEILSSYV